MMFWRKLTRIATLLVVAALLAGTTGCLLIVRHDHDHDHHNHHHKHDRHQRHNR